MNEQLDGLPETDSATVNESEERALYLADIGRDQLKIASSYERMATQPQQEGSFLTPEYCKERAAEIHTELPDLLRSAAEEWPTIWPTIKKNLEEHRDYASLEEHRDYASLRKNIGTALEEKTAPEKIAIVRNGLAAIEARQLAADEHGQTLSEQEQREMGDQQHALQHVLYEVASDHPELVPGLYVNSVINYVGNEIMKGRSLGDIGERHRIPVEPHGKDPYEHELELLEALLHDSYLAGLEDRIWKAVTRSFDPQLGKPFSFEDHFDIDQSQAHLKDLLDNPE